MGTRNACRVVQGLHLNPFFCQEDGPSSEAASVSFWAASAQEAQLQSEG